MGNHVAGQAIGRAAEVLSLRRQPGESALDILDRICGPYYACDTEFESEDPANPGQVHPDFDSYTDPHPYAALGLLMLEAFAPNGLADLSRYSPMLDAGNPREEAACAAWRAEVYGRFNARYGFC
jgi:hypothetical protein